MLLRLVVVLACGAFLSCFETVGTSASGETQRAAFRDVWVSAPGATPPFADPTVHFRSLSLRNMVDIAYAVTVGRVVGGPAWIDEPRWQVAAVANAQTVPYSGVRGMLREVLARELGADVVVGAVRTSVLRLRMAPGGARSNLRPAAARVDCGPILRDELAPGRAPKDAQGYSLCGASQLLGNVLSLRSAPLSAFARELEILLRLPVEVESSLSGLFDIDLPLPRGFVEGRAAPDVDLFMTILEAQFAADPRIETMPTRMVTIRGVRQPN